jgi:hypothetical protein
MAKKRAIWPVEILKAAVALRLAASARLLVCTAALMRGELTEGECDEAEAALTEHRAANRALSSAFRGFGCLPPTKRNARD